jgi:acetoacetate decarboxylase
MVLQGEGAGFSPPFDAPLFGANQGRSTPASDNYEIEYRNCEAMMSLFSIDNAEISDILPQEIAPYSTPPLGVAWFSHYPFSTVGEYNEFISLIQVEDLGGEMAYYCPYIYVTNDAAMAAGRELLGAPKKQADIDLDTTGSTIQGTIERPSGKRLMTATLQAEEQVHQNPLLNAAMPNPIPLLSFRHLPPIEGDDGITQLVKWYSRIRFLEDTRGDQRVWMGPTSLNYDSPSEVDPIHNLAVKDERLTMYFNFDMELGATEVLEERRV